MCRYYAQWDDLSEHDESIIDDPTWLDIEDLEDDLFRECPACEGSGCSSCLE